MGHLTMEFSLEQNPRVMVWYFYIKDHVEFVPRTSSCQTVRAHLPRHYVSVDASCGANFMVCTPLEKDNS